MPELVARAQAGDDAAFFEGPPLAEDADPLRHEESLAELSEWVEQMCTPAKNNEHANTKKITPKKQTQILSAHRDLRETADDRRQAGEAGEAE